MSDSSYKSQVAATWGFTRQATCTPCWKFVETFLFFTTLSFQRVLLIRVEKKEILQSCILFFVPRNKRSMSATWCTSGHLMLGRGGLVCTLTAREKPPKPLDRAFTPLARAYVLFVVWMSDPRDLASLLTSEEECEKHGPQTLNCGTPSTDWEKFNLKSWMNAVTFTDMEFVLNASRLTCTRCTPIQF